MSNVYPLAPEPHDITVTVDPAAGAAQVYDAGTDTTQLSLDGGDVVVSFGPPQKPRREGDFNANLAEDLTPAELSAIAERLLLGIEQDLTSRAEWLQNMSDGISLLGLKIKSPKGAATAGGTPAEGTSTVDHPLLLEAVLRFQANASGELLPSDGPVKVRNDGTGNALADELAEALEKDLNHYLTKTAKEYVPDTDRMLLLLGFSGISFKKGYHHPIKRRPVIESINAQDLIVSNAATDLEGSGRVTHRVMMRPSLLKRMQLVGAYRNVHLPQAGMPTPKDVVAEKINEVQGIAPPTYVEPADQERELYECYCEIEVPGYEHTIDGELTGLPLPYKITIDKDARTILEIRRNWAEDDEFCLPINRIIAYTFIPGLGFYGIGLLNVLGNATKAVTAAWRLMIDAGMFSNFPGFLYLKSLAKQLTNQFRVPPGGGMPIDTVGNDIRASVMPLPYKDPSPVFIQLIENIATTAARVGGTAEMQVGEGKQDAPVGTTLALIEQATKLMSAVHKRLHHAQGQEFDMLKDLLREDPAALWRHNKKSAVLKALLAHTSQETQQKAAAVESAEARHRELFLLALADCELVPRADPNTSSQTERYLKVVALRQMAQTDKKIDLTKVDEHAMRVMGIDDPQDFFAPDVPAGMEKPSPEEITADATKTAADARLRDSETKLLTAQTKAANDAANRQVGQQSKMAELATREKIAALGVAKELVVHNNDQEAGRHELGLDTQNRAADRLHELSLASLNNSARLREGVAARSHEANQGGLARRHEAIQAHQDRLHASLEGGIDRSHEAAQNDLDRATAPAGAEP